MSLLTRWLKPEGHAKRDQLLGCWRVGHPWREAARWPGEGDDARADLRWINLRGQKLAGVDLTDSRLDGACLDGADLSGARLCRSSLVEASLTRVTAIGLDAFAASLHGARLEDSTWARASFVVANLASSSWRRVSLREADLRGASLNGARLVGCHFEGVRLAGADLEGALILGARGLRRDRHDRDGSDARSPALAPLLRMHLQLLNQPSKASHQTAKDCLLGCSRPEAEAEALVLDEDWRVVLAGVAAALAWGPKPRVCQALWLALERGSWVAPQLAGAVSLLDDQFAERAVAFLAPDRPPAIGSGLGTGDPKAPKSLVSVAALLHRDGGLPASIASLPEAESTRQITLRWVEHAARAVRTVPSAREIAEIMAANMKANKEDPEFFTRRDARMSEFAREALAHHGLAGGGQPLPAPRLEAVLSKGRHTDVFLLKRDGQFVVEKVANALGPPLPLLTRKECEARFTTGLVLFGDPDPEELVRCEAEALSALAPATPPTLESGTKPNGHAYVLRAYVEGKTWRELLDRGSQVGREELRKLVEVLARVEESSVLRFHGDVKPDNVITTPAGEVVLIDPTSAFMRRIPNGPLERALFTGEYNPHLEASDHAALALTLIEMLTGRQLVTEAEDSAATRPIGRRLQDSQRFQAATGTDFFARRLVAIRLPSELLPALAGPAEALLLRALGLSWTEGVLDVGEPLGRIRELGAALAD